LLCLGYSPPEVIRGDTTDVVDVDNEVSQ